MGARTRCLAFGVALVVALGACIPNDPPRGYTVWATNESSTVYLISMSGEDSLGDTPNPALVTYLSPSRSKDLMGPWIDQVQADDGSLLLASVRVLSLDCQVVATFQIGAGEYHLVIDESGASRVEEYGWGQRPTSRNYLDETRQCLGG